MSELNASNLRKEQGNEGPDLVGTTELTSPYFMVPPSGTTYERPQNPQKGTLRFNTDIGTLEYFRGDVIGWEQIQRRESQYLGGGSGSNTGTGNRGLYMGGSTPTLLNNIDYLTIPTFGNSQDFGDLTATRTSTNAFGSHTRGATCGGVTPSNTNDTDMVFFSSLGNATDYATLSENKKEATVVSDKTRAVHIGGGNNKMEYITIEQGGTWVDFGDLTTAAEQCMGLSSSTRGVVAQGNQVPAGVTNAVDYITIATYGHSSDYGDLTDSRYGGSSGSNATRGCFSGGWSPNVVNVIDYITIATLGNAVDFGDMTQAKYSLSGSMSSKTRMVIGGGHQNPDPAVNRIESWEFATTGNGTDFGDLTAAKTAGGQCSNGHGGL
tara:strand:- start:3 stop:1142 length:1140 start_codon:yes stop_codon:yes gene_type:complete